MKSDYNRLKTASRLKNWIACNYTTINEINKKELKKKEQSTTELIRKEKYRKRWSSRKCQGNLIRFNQGTNIRSIN